MDIQVNFDRVYYAYLVDLLVCRRDQSCCDLEICFTRNMAAPITAGGTYRGTDPNAADVVRCLNAPTSLDIRNIASDDVLTNLVTDYFVTCQIGKLQHGR